LPVFSRLDRCGDLRRPEPVARLPVGYNGSEPFLTDAAGRISHGNADFADIRCAGNIAGLAGAASVSKALFR